MSHFPPSTGRTAVLLACLTLLTGLATACTTPGASEEGGYCDPSAPPEPCYGFPEMQGDDVVCHSGFRTCEGGRWSACDMQQESVIGHNTAALITGPTECNPCQPNCFISEDSPDSSDLTPGNSDGVEYDPSSGGIVVDGALDGPPPLVDSDGDGVPDVADDFPGDPTRDGVRENGGFSHTLAIGDPGVLDPIDISVQVRTADIYFLMDTTGSMGGEIANLRSSLTSGNFIAGCGGGVIGAIRCTIPDAWFGVGYHDDYRNVYPYGSSVDHVYRNVLDIGPSTASAQAAVNGLGLHYGRDWAESQSQALWAVATGGGLGSHLPPKTSCPGGRWGYPCFRDGAIPIVILFTDAPFHNGPNGYNYHNFGGSYPVSWSQTVNALNARNMKVITIVSSSAWQTMNDVNALADATGSTNSGGGRYVFPISSSGTGLGAAVVDAVVDLANYSRIDVSVRAVDNPGTGFDERQFLANVAANGWGPGSCAGIVSGRYFRQCLPGTSVDFTVTFRNDVVMGTTVPQVFNFNLEVVGDGAFVIDTIPVRIVVPPARPMLPPQGSYWRDFDSTRPVDGVETCPQPPKRAYWGVFEWSSTTPDDSAIRFEFRTADTAAALPAATPAYVELPPNTDVGSVNVGELLADEGLGDNHPYLRITSVLISSTDRTTSPTLYNTSLVYECRDAT